MIGIGIVGTLIEMIYLIQSNYGAWVIIETFCG